VLAAAILLLFWTAPRNGDFWWSDAPRHAMDGVFYSDLARERPVDIKQYAMDYYLQYPALTILFYPPMFPMVEAVFFLLLGVGHPTAQLSISVFYLAAAYGAYALSRRWLPWAGALAAALLFVGAPEAALWGRQVMLEIPACAFLFWSCWVFLKYLDRRRALLLFTSLVLLVMGMNTKQTLVFIAPVFAIMLWSACGWKFVRDRKVWAAVALFVVLLIPLIVFTLKFGRVNYTSIVGGTWKPEPLFSWESLTYYIRYLPSQIGWPAVALAGTYLALWTVQKDRREQGRGFLLLWLTVGYAFFCLIALKEPRHTVVILMPVAFFAVAAIYRLCPRRLAPAAALVLAGGTYIYTLYRCPVPAVNGYREAADYIVRSAPANSVILFSGHRDGSFIFNMRELAHRRNLTVLRSDKLLLRVAQRRELGIQEEKFSMEEIGAMLDRYGVTYVVSQPNYWDDLRPMQRLQRLLHTAQFEEVASIPVTSNASRTERVLEANHSDRVLKIYRNLHPVPSVKSHIRIDLPIIDTFVEGDLGRPER
jgi:hypothetical protein